MTLPFLFLTVPKIQSTPSPAYPTGSSLLMHIHCLREGRLPPGLGLGAFTGYT